MDLHYGFEEQMEAVRSGWLQGRYHSAEGDLVADLLSFNAVFEVNPFEVGASRARERRAFGARRRLVERLLEVRPLLRRPFVSLSNGEMRRVLFARALLKGPERLVLDDPFGGLDPDWRARMRQIAEELARHGVEVVARRPEPGGGRAGRAILPGRDVSTKRPQGDGRGHGCEVVVEMRNVNVSFGRRTLFRNFSWTIREGERWVLRGPNGSGKTTLLALITGDSPRGYACGVTVFGKRRGDEGVTLAGVRSAIGEVSAERQVYLGATPDEQLDEALSRNPRLLLLDEPCYNLAPRAAKRLLRRVAKWLDAHPRAAAVCVAHRPEHVPPGFAQEMSIG
jgi:ABC-type molybdenum transport system ATPase subunit/photorepair protein PhrA